MLYTEESRDIKLVIEFRDPYYLSRRYKIKSTVKLIKITLCSLPADRIALLNAMVLFNDDFQYDFTLIDILNVELNEWLGLNLPEDYFIGRMDQIRKTNIDNDIDFYIKKWLKLKHKTMYPVSRHRLREKLLSNGFYIK
ncbi:hypothetical protein BN7_3310 [Wickerhamomyces ciferrii]|uniref:Uncharacterized protein n=1 Tax=Wickerhamomyces ciferrii (strain ATCC 14091 / BCRC 22168 / CBS 111 / JCM 3599 / NBRC 0793 / NRRL Y-1031 F-60-10) TaxID=1206466 RepID=K0KLB1_WICCF|nr:uncharacterized protein BN7_3310 [Wickerhamomyces ciferrii]CCH43756.1 hypothetical protein BN7_3310 [Wickerhamomyces ciferrii]